MSRTYAVYILARKSGVLYAGVTNDLERRIWQHKNKAVAGFTARYNIDKLVCFEHYEDIHDAITREKELKGWTRARKIELISKGNPLWSDLAADWFPS